MYSKALTRGRRTDDSRYLGKMVTVAIAIVGLAFSSATFAAPITWHFTHSGFDEGAVVTGTFAGQDSNGDGRLQFLPPKPWNSSPPQELTGFSMHFSGNSLVPAFAMGFSDLRRFAYNLSGGSLLGDEFGEGFAVGYYRYGMSRLRGGSVATPGESNKKWSYTSEAVVVTQVQSVPEPSAFGLMALGLAVIAFLGRKRRKAEAG